MVALSGAKGNYIVYATSGKCNKIPMIQGSKWYVPRMLFRMWGWLDTKGELFVDFQGGDISVLAEFDEIMKELMSKQ